jgi:hypothetical protein
MRKVKKTVTLCDNSNNPLMQKLKLGAAGSASRYGSGYYNDVAPAPQQRQKAQKY